MIFSFSGLDGSGKSTQIKILAEKLEKENRPVIIKLVYAQGTYLRIGNLLKRMAPRKAEEMVANQYKNRLEWSFKKCLLRWIRQFCLMLDIAVYFFGSHLPFKNSSKILLCDRYFYDILVQMTYVGMCSRLFFRAIKPLIPGCTISFLLLDKTTALLERKVEYDLDYYREKDKLYRGLARHFKMTPIEGKSLMDTTRVVFLAVQEALGGNDFSQKR
ncbi:hypothetical protein HY732_05005 [Candidatus Uhrbacteria bacterium]|nr:hypothetical protein [Candidatus Uhrbacteria bacterium]